MQDDHNLYGVGMSKKLSKILQSMKDHQALSRQEAYFKNRYSDWMHHIVDVEYVRNDEYQIVGCEVKGYGYMPVEPLMSAVVGDMYFDIQTYILRIYNGSGWQAMAVSSEYNNPYVKVPSDPDKAIKLSKPKIPLNFALPDYNAALDKAITDAIEEMRLNTLVNVNTGEKSFSHIMMPPTAWVEKFALGGTVGIDPVSRPNPVKKFENKLESKSTAHEVKPRKVKIRD